MNRETSIKNQTFSKSFRFLICLVLQMTLCFVNNGCVFEFHLNWWVNFSDFLKRLRYLYIICTLIVRFWILNQSHAMQLDQSGQNLLKLQASKIWLKISNRSQLAHQHPRCCEAIVETFYSVIMFLDVWNGMIYILHYHWNRRSRDVLKHIEFLGKGLKNSSCVYAQRAVTAKSYDCKESPKEELNCLYSRPYRKCIVNMYTFRLSE